jgi:pimeloyl-ACP methyl ester carboxylesterase
VLVGQDWGGLACWMAASVWPRQVRRIAVLGMPHPLRVRHQYAVSPRGQGLAGAHFFGFQLPWLPERQLVADGAARVGEYLRSWSGAGSELGGDGQPGAAGITDVFPGAEEERRYRAAMRIPGVVHSALEYHRWTFRSLFRPDGSRFAQALRRGVSCPVLHLHGGADPFLLPGTAQGSGRYVSGPYQWQLVPGAGHFLPEEAPDLVGDLLVDWLATPLPPPAA